MAHLELIVTEDGSHTLYNPDLKEHYHSTHGAIQEGMHVFIAAGLREVAKKKKSIRILEVGFGTGLNCMLTMLEAWRTGLKIEYDALEPYPLSERLLCTLNYAGLLDFHDNPCDFELIHTENEGEIEVSDTFQLIKYKQGIQAFTPEGTYDLIYMDAFAPQVQPDMWTEKVFKKLFDCLPEGGILVTYCAQGQVKRNMKAAGFTLDRLPGPPGKREMTRAVK
jgi:tRNA U34 5-methylaminomethyl-2-thiouridine-forming methyltransferase MnmC